MKLHVSIYLYLNICMKTVGKQVSIRHYDRSLGYNEKKKKKLKAEFMPS